MNEAKEAVKEERRRIKAVIEESALPNKAEVISVIFGATAQARKDPKWADLSMGQTAPWHLNRLANE